jgi:hypothetical protein
MTHKYFMNSYTNSSSSSNRPLACVREVKAAVPVASRPCDTRQATRSSPKDGVVPSMTIRGWWWARGLTTNPNSP